MVAGIKEKAGAHEDAKTTAQRTVGQSVKQNWDCSQIEYEEEEEEEDQMEVQWAEDERVEKILERRRMEGSLQAEVMQKVLELVVHERMLQGEKAGGTRGKKKVKGWSTEEMKDNPSSSLEEDTREMIEWRSMSQQEMDECRKKLTEQIEEEVLDKYKVEDRKRCVQEQRHSLGLEACAKKQEVWNTKVRRRLLGKNCCLAECA